jgi:hypothetical protein
MNVRQLDNFSYLFLFSELFFKVLLNTFGIGSLEIIGMALLID